MHAVFSKPLQVLFADTALVVAITPHKLIVNKIFRISAELELIVIIEISLYKLTHPLRCFCVEAIINLRDITTLCLTQSGDISLSFIEQITLAVNPF